MLEHVHIVNFVLIDDIDIDFALNFPINFFKVKNKYIY